MKRVFDIPPTKPAPEPSFFGGKGASIVDALKAQQDASLLIPTIQSPPVPESKEIGPQSLQLQTITIAASQKYPVQLKGDFIYIEGFSWAIAGPVYNNYPLTATLQMRTDTLQTPIVVSEAHRDYKFPAPYNFIEFENKSTLYAVTVQFWSGFGDIRRDRNAAVKLTWSQALYVGAPLVISKDHFLTAGPIRFDAITSQYVQSSIILSASISKSLTTTVPPPTSLWLFSAQVPNVTVNQPFDCSITTLGIPGCAMIGKIDFTTWTTGDNAVSLTYFSEVTNVSLPIFSNQSVNLNPFQFPLYAYLVTTANYNSPGADLWDLSLEINFA